MAKKKAKRKPAASASAGDAHLQQLLAGTAGPSKDGLLSGLTSLLGGMLGSGRKARGALDEAQDLMYEAWETDDVAQRAALAIQALDISPDCADAYVLLAEEMAGSEAEATDCYRRGVEAGERALGPNGLRRYAGHFWGCLETRPYMRARAGLAQCLWATGNRDEAVAHYQEMLRLNPNDNQGIRYVLASCLLQLERLVELDALLADFADDASAVWSFTRVLLAFLRGGDSEAARQALAEAVQTNRYVPAYLMGTKKLPRRLPDYVGFGDESEAICYAAENREIWSQTPGALHWLKDRKQWMK